MTFFLACLIAALLGPPGRKETTKDVLKHTYDHKYLVVLREGLAVGVCARRAREGYSSSTDLPKIIVYISGNSVQLESPGKFSLLMPENCETVAPSPIHSGQILVVKGSHVVGGELRLSVETVSINESRPVNPLFRSDSEANRAAEFRFKLRDADNYSECVRQVEGWVKVFASPQDAESFNEMRKDNPTKK